jgi:hypothetical protein
MRRASLLKQKMKKKTHPIFFKFFFLTSLNTKINPHSQGSKSKFFFICTQHFNNIGYLNFVFLWNRCLDKEHVLM